MAFKDGELPDKFRGYTHGGLLDEMMPSPDFIEYQRKINEELLRKTINIPNRAELLAELYNVPKVSATRVLAGVPVFNPTRYFIGVDTGTDPDQLNIKVKRKHKLKFNFNN